MFDAVVISDLHLGSDNCQAKRLTQLLESIASGEFRTTHLILNGDLFDSIDFRRLNKHHWKVLSLLRKLSDHIEIVWLCGNHDGSAEIVSHLLGVEVRDDYILESGNRHVLFMHGHVHDDWLEEHPILTWFADCIYAFLQWIDKTHYLAKVAKKGSKTFLRCAKKIENAAIEMARRLHCTDVCCGHTHQCVVNRTGPVHYYNSGCWTELPGTFLTVADGHIELHSFDPDNVVPALPPTRRSEVAVREAETVGAS
jgi:UDP-2,3-diacylglucosamine pyrophosphatase LpxH